MDSMAQRNKTYQAQDTRIIFVAFGPYMEYADSKKESHSNHFTYVLILSWTIHEKTL